MMMFCAQPGWISRNSPSSTIGSMTSCMSYGCDGSSGTIVSSAASRAIDRIACPDRAARHRGCSAAGTPSSRRAAVERLGLVVRREVRDAAPRRVGRRAAERLGVDLLVRHGLHDVRAGDEHVARPLDHDREVGDRRRVHRAAGARAHDDRELRDDARTPARCAGRCRRSRRATRRLPGFARRPNR